MGTPGHRLIQISEQLSLELLKIGRLLAHVRAAAEENPFVDHQRIAVQICRYTCPARQVEPLLREDRPLDGAVDDDFSPSQKSPCLCVGPNDRGSGDIQNPEYVTLDP
jgi:hypothetical protein